MKEGCCAAKAPVPETMLWDKVVLYRPLIVITAVSLLSAGALSVHGGLSFMNAAMGTFLFFLGALKLFSLRKFVDGFARYDLVANRFRGYGLAYPFIELALGSLYVSGLFPVATNMLMIAVMFTGTAGVARTIRSGSSVQCACVGTGFSLPVGRVTLCENLVMAAMALINLLH